MHVKVKKKNIEFAGKNSYPLFRALQKDNTVTFKVLTGHYKMEFITMVSPKIPAPLHGLISSSCVWPLDERCPSYS